MSVASDPEFVARFENGAVRCRWRSDWAPADSRVRILVLDAASAVPVEGLAITYDASSAVITGAALVEGRALVFKPWIEAPDASVVRVTVHTLDPPTGLVADDRGGGIFLRWTDVADIGDYRVDITDTSGVRIDPPPQVVVHRTEAGVDADITGHALANGRTFRLRVAIGRDGSFSTWSTPVDWTLDTSAPDSALLRSLRTRLLAAGPTPLLDADLIGAVGITDLFAPLLGTATIELSGAVTRSSTDDVIVEGGATLFGRSTHVTAIFRVRDGALTVELDAPLGPLTLAELQEMRIVPGSQWAVSEWSAGLTMPGACVLRLDSAAATVRIVGDVGSAAAWNIVSVAGMQVGSVRPDLAVSLRADGLRAFSPCFLSSLIVGGASLPVRLTIPSGMDGWRIALDAPDGVALREFSALGSLFGAQGAGLPAGVDALGALTLERLSLDFAPGGTSWRFDCGFAMNAGRWAVIENALVVDTIRVDLSWRLYAMAAGVESDVRGALYGRILLAGIPVEAMITIPAGPEGWLLATAEPIPLVDLRTLADLTGGDATVVPGAVASIGTAGALSLDRAEMRFHPPSPASLDTVCLAFSATGLSVPGLDWLRIDTATLAVVIDRPLRSDREVAVLATVAAQIGGGFALNGTLTRDSERLAIALSGETLDDMPAGTLQAIIPQPDFETALPPGMTRRFRLRDLSGSFDVPTRTLLYAALDLEAQADWEIVPDALTLESVAFEMSLQRAAATVPWTVTGRAFAAVEIGSGRFEAVVQKHQAGWSASLELDSDTTLNLTDLTRTLAGGVTRVPAGFPDVTVELARVAIDLATLETRAALSTAATWSPTVLNARANLAQIGLDFQVGPRVEGSSREYTLTVAGALTIDGFPTLAAVCATGSGEARSELLATLSQAQGEAVSLDGAADSLVGSGSLSSVPLPQGFVIPPFASAGFYADITDPTVVVWGQMQRLGTAAFVAQRLPVPDASPASDRAVVEDSRPLGVAVLIATDDFRFASLLPATASADARARYAALDAAVRVEHAHLVVSSFTMADGAGDPFTRIARVAQAAAALRITVPTPTIPAAFKLRRGLNFSATVLLTGGVWENLKFVIERRAAAPIVLTAVIDSDTPANTLFEARLGGFAILRALAFDTVALSYRPSAETSLTIEVAGSVGIPGGPPPPVQPVVPPPVPPPPAPPQPIPVDPATPPADTILTFAGTLAIGTSVARADLAIAAGTVLNRPLGLPGVSFTDLALVVDYQFTDAQGVTDRRLTRLAVRGRALLGGHAVEAWVLFASGAPQVALLRFGQEIALNVVFDQMLGTAWFAELPALTLTSGEIYYARTALVEREGKTYAAGLQIDARFAFMGHRFDLGATLAEKIGLRGFARAPAALTVGVVRLTDRVDPNAGPGLEIAARRDGPKTLGFSFGATLFGHRFNDGRMGYAYVDGKHRLEGALTYQGEETLLGTNFEIGVRWSEDDGFEIIGWEALTKVAADLKSVFEGAGSSDACRALGSFITGALLEGECKAAIRMKSKALATGSTAEFEVDVRYLISVPGIPDRIVLNEWAPPLTLTFSIPDPSGFTFDQLGGRIANEVRSKLGEMARSILNDPVSAGLLAAALSVETLTERALNALICRKADNPKLKEEYRARTGRGPQPDPGRSRPPSGPDPARIAAQELVVAEVAAGTATIEVAAASFAAADVAVVGATAFLSALSVAVVALFGAQSLEDHDARERQRELDRSRDAIRATLRARLRIEDLTAVREGEHGLTLSCRPIGPPTRYMFVVAIRGRDGSTATVTVGANRSSADNPVHIVDPCVGPGAVVTIRASASLPVGDAWIDGEESAPVEVRLPDHGPTALAVEQVEGVVRLDWQAGPDPVSTWRVRAEPAIAGTDVAVREESLPGATCSWVLTDPVAGQDYLFTVGADGIPGAIPQQARIVIGSDAAPQWPSYALDSASSRLTIAWTARAFSATRVMLDIGARRETVDVAADGTETTFDGVAPGTVGARVRIGAVNGSSVHWSAWRALDLTAPPDVQEGDLSLRHPALTAQWSIPGSAEPSDVRVEVRFVIDTAGDGRTLPADGAATPSGGQWTARLSSGFDDGDTVVSQARAIRGSVAGRWIDGAPDRRLEVRRLAAPESPQALVDPDAVSLRWGGVPDATGYEVTVIDIVTQAVLWVEQIDVAALSIPSSRLAGIVGIRADIRGVRPRIFGAVASVETAIGRASPVTGLSGHYVDQAILLTWTAVAAATGYQVRLFDAQDMPAEGRSFMADAGEAPALRIDARTLSTGTSVRVMVRPVVPGHFADWSPGIDVPVARVPMPQFTARYDADARRLEFLSIDIRDATTIEMVVVDTAGAVVAGPTRRRSGTMPWTVTDLVLPQRPLRVKLRGWQREDEGPWGESPPFGADPDPPAGVRIEDRGATLAVHFDPVAGVESYQVEVVDGAGTPLAPAMVAEGPSSPIVLPAERLASGSAYRVRVRSVVIVRSDGGRP